MMFFLFPVLLLLLLLAMAIPAASSTSCPDSFIPSTLAEQTIPLLTSNSTFNSSFSCLSHGNNYYMGKVIRFVAPSTATYYFKTNFSAETPAVETTMVIKSGNCTDGEELICVSASDMIYYGFRIWAGREYSFHFAPTLEGDVLPESNTILFGKLCPTFNALSSTVEAQGRYFSFLYTILGNLPCDDRDSVVAPQWLYVMTFQPSASGYYHLRMPMDIDPESTFAVLAIREGDCSSQTSNYFCQVSNNYYNNTAAAAAFDTHVFFHAEQLYTLLLGVRNGSAALPASILLETVWSTAPNTNPTCLGNARVIPPTLVDDEAGAGGSILRLAPEHNVTFASGKQARFVSFRPPVSGYYFMRLNTTAYTDGQQESQHAVALDVQTNFCHAAFASCGDTPSAHTAGASGKIGFDGIYLSMDNEYYVLLSSAQCNVLELNASHAYFLEVGYCGSACAPTLGPTMTGPPTNVQSSLRPTIAGAGGGERESERLASAEILIVILVPITLFLSAMMIFFVIAPCMRERRRLRLRQKHAVTPATASVVEMQPRSVVLFHGQEETTAAAAQDVPTPRSASPSAS